jgi:hypothetical protein
MTPFSEVLPDTHAQLWVTSGERTMQVQLHPEHGGDAMLPLRLPRVFAGAQLTPDGQGVRWPGGFTLSRHLLEGRTDHRWLTHLGSVPVQERYRPLLPLLRCITTGIALPPQPSRVNVLKLFGMSESELGGILRAYRVPEDVMLHRLYDLGLFLKSHLYAEMPVAVLKRPWAYAVHRVPQQQSLHSLLGCLALGRLDLVEDPCWALARAEVATS